MATQIEQARAGIVTPQMAAVAHNEQFGEEYVRRMVAEDEATCTMCGEFCASRGAGRLFKGDLKGDKI